MAGAWWRLGAAAGLVVAAGCSEPTEDARDGWLLNTLVEDNQAMLERDPKLVAGKFARMARTPHEYLRGSLGQFVRDASQPWEGQVDSAFGGWEEARVLVLGDPHLENLGTFLHADGRLRVGFNDFDAASYGPWVYDLRRLALSVAVLASELGPLGLEGPPEAWAEPVVRGYVGEWARLLGGGARVDATGEAAREGLEPAEAPDEGAILAGLVEVAREEGDKERELEDWTRTPDGGPRVFREGDLEPAEGWIIEERLTPLSKDEAQVVEQVMGLWPQSLSAPSLVGAERRGVKDVARRYGVGVSSYPLLRWYVLVEGEEPRDGDDVLLELKEIQDPPVVEGAPLWPTRAFTQNARRVVEAQRRFQGDELHDPWLGWAQVGSLSLRVRRLARYNQGLNLSDVVEGVAEGEWGGPDLEALGRRAGMLLAQHHARGGTLDGGDAGGVIGPAVSGREEELVEETRGFVASYGPRVLDDHQRLRRLLDERGPWLGYERLGGR